MFYIRNFKKFSGGIRVANSYKKNINTYKEENEL